MDVFEQFRQDSEPTALTDPEFERTEATFGGCPHGSLVCPIAWQDIYGEVRCAWCAYPPAMALVRRVLVLVPTSLASNYVVSLEPGELCDMVERPDMLATWRRLEREQAARKIETREQEATSDGY